MAQTILFADLAHSTLAGAISNTSTAVALAPGSGSLFPVPGAGQYFPITFQDSATGLIIEIAHCVARIGDALTVVRGQEGTVAQSYVAGDIVENRMTAATMASLVQFSDLLDSGGSFAIDSGSVDALAVTLNPVPASLAAISGAPLRIQAANGVTGASTLTVNTSGGPLTRPLNNINGSPLINGQIAAGTVFTCTYNQGSNEFVMQSVRLPLHIDTETDHQLPVSRISGIFQPLTANTTYYVDASAGNDSNNGLTAGTAWQTLQHAVDFIVSNVDLAGYIALISCTGTFTAGVITTKAWRGGSASSVIFSFAPSTEVNVISSSCFFCSGEGAGFSVNTPSGTEVICTATGAGVNEGSVIIASRDTVIYQNINFGACSQAHIVASNNGIATCVGSYTVSGSASQHQLGNLRGEISYTQPGTQVTLTGTPAFTQWIELGDQSLAIVPHTAVAFIGSGATGSRYTVLDTSVIDTQGGGATFFPGNAAGTGGVMTTPLFGIYM